MERRITVKTPTFIRARNYRSARRIKLKSAGARASPPAAIHAVSEFPKPGRDGAPPPSALSRLRTKFAKRPGVSQHVGNAPLFRIVTRRKQRELLTAPLP